MSENSFVRKRRSCSARLCLDGSLRPAFSVSPGYNSNAHGNTITAGMSSYKSYVLIALSALLVSEVWAGKTVNGLSFELSPPPTKQCIYQPFQVRHEANA